MKILLILIFLASSGCMYVKKYEYDWDDDERYYCEEFIFIQNRYYHKKCIKKVSLKETVNYLVKDIREIKELLKKAHEENKVLEDQLNLDCKWNRNFDWSYWPNSDCPETYICEKK